MYEFFSGYGILSLIFALVWLVIAILLFILMGYLWNYFLIQELRRTNKKLDALADAIGINLSKIAQNTAPENRRNVNETTN